MKKVFREFVKAFASNFNHEQQIDSQLMAKEIRATADESETFENTVFEIGVAEMVRRMRKDAEEKANSIS